MSRQLSAADRAAIEAALQAGRVTRLPSGPAAGLSALEEQFGAVRPAASEAHRLQHQRHAQAGARATSRRRAGA